MVCITLNLSCQVQTLITLCLPEIRTYAEALDFLGADHNTADEWISTLAATKYEEDPSTTQRALDLISEERHTAPYLSASKNRLQRLLSFQAVGLHDADRRPNGLLRVFFDDGGHDLPQHFD